MFFLLLQRMLVGFHYGLLLRLVLLPEEPANLTVARIVYSAKPPATFSIDFAAVDVSPSVFFNGGRVLTVVATLRVIDGILGPSARQPFGHYAV